jgi:hypothetical protein
MKDYYSILEIRKNASIDDIKKSYRKLALKFHPDVCNEPNTEQKFIEITEAYQILSDTEQRKIYDELISGIENDDNTSRFETYKKKAQQKAETYAHFDISKFKETILDNLNQAYETSKRGAKLGCGIYGGLLFLCAGIFGIFKWIEYWFKVFHGEKEVEFWPIISITWILIFAWLGFVSLKELIDK